MIYATSPELAKILADTYSIRISLAIIPEIFQNRLIVPIIKNATIDPMIPNNYRPIGLLAVIGWLQGRLSTSEIQIYYLMSNGYSYTFGQQLICTVLQGDSSREDSGSMCLHSGPNHSQITIYKSGMWHCWGRGWTGGVSLISAAPWWLRQTPVWRTYTGHNANEGLLEADLHTNIDAMYLF